LVILIRARQTILTANQQRVWSRRTCDAQLEILGRFDWPLLSHHNAIMLFLTARTPQQERRCLPASL